MRCVAWDRAELSAGELSPATMVETMGQLMKQMTTRQKIPAVIQNVLESGALRPHGPDLHGCSQHCGAALRAYHGQLKNYICTVPKMSGTCTQKDTDTILKCIDWAVPEGTELGLVFCRSVVTTRKIVHRF